MLDLSPEKLIVLLAVGLVVLGPNKLPAAARSLAHGLARARRLAATLTDPITTTVFEPVKANLAELTEPVRTGLTEPVRTGLTGPLEVGLGGTRRAVDGAVADLRAAIAAHPLTPPDRGAAAAVDPSLN